MCLAANNIFLLQLDVANQKGQFFNSTILPMKTITLAFYIITAVVLFALIPFTIFWYEGMDDMDDPNGKT